MNVFKAQHIHTEATEIKHAGPDTVNAHGWQIQRGYVYRVEAGSDDVWDCSIEYELSDGSTHTEQRRYGYHGCDVPPCCADYLYGTDDGSELLVMSSESDPEQIEVVDGFTLVPERLEEGEFRNDGTWQFRVLQTYPDGETILAGIC